MLIEQLKSWVRTHLLRVFGSSNRGGDLVNDSG